MIEVKDLRKEFKKPIRGEGISGMVKTLFSRKYETKVAVKDINFTINEGEMVGYIGSNGAGKSTTIKMMCGILTPSSGQVLIKKKTGSTEYWSCFWTKNSAMVGYSAYRIL